MKKSQEDRHRYRTVQVWDENRQAWHDHTRRVTPFMAAKTLSELEHFGYKGRIVPNVFYAGVFGPQAEKN